MKAIYLNLDAAVAAVLAGEKPVQPELPVAVTIPAGQTAAVFAQTGTGTATTEAGSNVTGVTWTFSPSLGDAIVSSVSPGMSQVLSSESANVYAVTGGAFTATATIKNSDTTVGTFAVQVVVNRETLDGPVDLVDFTLPSSGGELTADAINTALGGTGAVEGSPLKGVSLANATGAPTPSAADIKSTLVAAGNGALAGVKLGGAILMITADENTATKIQTNVPDDPDAEPVMVNGPRWSNENSFTIGRGGAS